ncbi:hypothetical protein HPB48_001241 [Haemaphysalis longicornis]|uniref:Uncharacterized protein n=1 Tax=Haemaphysalis longicornis TaxID=44386 RepID=A0A9J6F8W3_HAELO|nr:hypothetical protein HPB48_001241 [Haemaphysalis longicornis]
MRVCTPASCILSSTRIPKTIAAWPIFTSQWYSMDLEQLDDEFLRSRFVQCGLDADTRAFLQSSTEKSNWLGTQILHALARLFLGWFLTKTTLNGESQMARLVSDPSDLLVLFACAASLLPLTAMTMIHGGRAWMYTRGAVVCLASNRPVLVAPCKDACRELRRNVPLCRGPLLLRPAPCRAALLQAWPFPLRDRRLGAWEAAAPPPPSSATLSPPNVGASGGQKGDAGDA